MDWCLRHESALEGSTGPRTTNFCLIIMYRQTTKLHPIAWGFVFDRYGLATKIDSYIDHYDNQDEYYIYA